EKGEHLIGMGIRLLPPDAAPWPAARPAVGLALGRRMHGLTEVSLQGWRALNPSLPVEGTTSFRAGSIAKVITAAGVLLLAHHGLVRQSDRLADHLPPWLPRSIIDDSPTISDALQHRAGFPRDLSDIPVPDSSRETLLYHACALAHRAAPAYSNVGYEVLGLVIEERTGTPAPQWLTDNVLDPLKMHRSGFTDRPDSADGFNVELGFVYRATDIEIAPTSGGLSTTIDDLMQLGQWLARCSADLHPGSSLPSELAVEISSEGFGMFMSEVSRGQPLRCFGGNLPGYQAGLVLVVGVGSTAVLANTGSYGAPATAMRLAASPSLPIQSAETIE
ncbi:MAG: serine hydrolase domain-containing protein, partial [Pseudonocardiaceae bacterium]